MPQKSEIGSTLAALVPSNQDELENFIDAPEIFPAVCRAEFLVLAENICLLASYNEIFGPDL